METFSALLALCAGNSPVTGEIPTQWPVTRNFDVFFDLRLNKRLSEQSWGWWFETPSCPLWRLCNAVNEQSRCRWFAMTLMWLSRDVFRYNVMRLTCFSDRLSRQCPDHVEPVLDHFVKLYFYSSPQDLSDCPEFQQGRARRMQIRNDVIDGGREGGKDGGMVDLLVDQSISRMIDLLIDRSIDWSIDLLIDLVDWFNDRSIYWSK